MLTYLYLPREYLNVTLVASFLSALVLIGLFHYLNHFTKRRYFTIWKTGWLFYALWLALQFNWRPGADSPELVMMQQWSVGASATFLLWGTACFLELRTRQTLFAWFLGFLLLWSYVGVFPFDESMLARITLFSFLGLSSWAAAAGFFRLSYSRHYLGAGLLAFGFFMWGLQLASFPLFQAADALVCSGVLSAAVLQLFIAVSMIILTLEEARSANQRAQQVIETQKTEQKVLTEKVISTEERYRTLFEQAGEGIFIVDATNLGIMELNQAALRLLGLSRAEAARHRFTTFCRFVEAIDPAPQTGAEWFDAIARQGRLHLVRRDGEALLTEAAGSVVQFEGRVAYQFYFREITERARLEQQVRQGEKLAALGQMISGVAHELNNPLAVVKGYLELILARPELNDATRTDLEKVAQESNRAARLVSNFLSFARQRPVERQAVNFNELIHRLVELRKFDFRVAGVELLLELAENLPKTQADPDQVHQILMNLITNSIHAMAEKTGSNWLSITTRQTPDGVQILVEDSGPGVPAHLQTRIFEPFFTTKQVGSGTGLGLSIAHSIMSDHHGRISYQNASLGGAGFLLEFPLLHTPEQKTEATNAASGCDIGEQESPSMSAQILVLDDEKSLAEMLGEMLGTLGHQPTVCFSASQAMELLKEGDFDLILSDYRMPNVNGQEFYRRTICKRPELARRIVFLTGDMLTTETRAFLESTGNPHLAKPFHLEEVENIISKILREQGRSQIRGANDVPAEAVLAA